MNIAALPNAMIANFVIGVLSLTKIRKLIRND